MISARLSRRSSCCSHTAAQADSPALGQRSCCSSASFQFGMRLSTTAVRPQEQLGKRGAGASLSLTHSLTSICRSSNRSYECIQSSEFRCQREQRGARGAVMRERLSLSLSLAHPLTRSLSLIRVWGSGSRHLRHHGREMRLEARGARQEDITLTHTHTNSCFAVR